MTEPVRTRAAAWSKPDPAGAEFAVVTLADDRLSATGVAIGSAPEPYRLDYELQTGPRFAARAVHVAARGPAWSRWLELRREAAGWVARAGAEGSVALPAPGGDVSALDEAIDPDLGLSPLFNSMPVLRHRLHEVAGAYEFMMVWISVPDLAIHASPQRYTHLATLSPHAHQVRFEATGEGEEFVADVVFDADGIVLDYPGIATRMR